MRCHSVFFVLWWCWHSCSSPTGPSVGSLVASGWGKKPLRVPSPHLCHCWRSGALRALLLGLPGSLALDGVRWPGLFFCNYQRLMPLTGPESWSRAGGWHFAAGTVGDMGHQQRPHDGGRESNMWASHPFGKKEQVLSCFSPFLSFFLSSTPSSSCMQAALLPSLGHVAKEKKPGNAPQCRSSACTLQPQHVPPSSCHIPLLLSVM